MIITKKIIILVYFKIKSPASHFECRSILIWSTTEKLVVVCLTKKSKQYYNITIITLPIFAIVNWREKTKNNEEKRKQNKQSEINQHLDLQRRNKKMHHKRAQKTKNPTKIHSSFKFCHVLWNKLSITFIDTILMLNSNKCIPSSHCQLEIFLYTK